MSLHARAKRSRHTSFCIFTRVECNHLVSVIWWQRIPAITHAHTGKPSRWQVHLNPKNTKVSLFSHLDKTIAVIQPKRDKGFILFIFNCQSLQSSARWYAFIRDCLTAPLPSKTIIVTVPDLDNLEIQMNTQCLAGASPGRQGQTAVDIHPISAKDIVHCCMTELRKVDRYRDVLDYWERNYEMGLCWKRYDRIEWLTGTMNRDQYELAGSWSLLNVSSSFSI